VVVDQDRRHQDRQRPNPPMLVPPSGWNAPKTLVLARVLLKCHANRLVIVSLDAFLGKMVSLLKITSEKFFAIFPMIENLPKVRGGRLWPP
jgi:hypothetical protein